MDVQALIETLPLIGKGLAGIFISVLAIMAVITIMGLLSKNKGGK